MSQPQPRQPESDPLSRVRRGDMVKDSVSADDSQGLGDGLAGELAEMFPTTTVDLQGIWHATGGPWPEADPETASAIATAARSTSVAAPLPTIEEDDDDSAPDVDDLVDLVDLEGTISGEEDDE